jgi:hypothetical protein
MKENRLQTSTLRPPHPGIGIHGEVLVEVVAKVSSTLLPQQQHAIEQEWQWVENSPGLPESNKVETEQLSLFRIQVTGKKLG